MPKAYESEISLGSIGSNGSALAMGYQHIEAIVPLTSCEERALRGWLAHIEETDEAIVADVVSQCQADENARDYFLGRASEVPRTDLPDDDRRCCERCANLTERGLCLAARRGEIVASRGYEPIRNLFRRCEGYAPCGDDPDQRPRHERWPGLTEKGSNDGNT